MNTRISASQEARLKNSKDLVIRIKELELYSPSSDDIKTANYEAFVDQAILKMRPFTIALGKLNDAINNNQKLFQTLDKTARKVLSEIGEVKGKSSPEYSKIRSYVNLLTGRNVSERGKVNKEQLKKVKEGEEPPKTISVSAMDYKSKIGNFRLLTGQLKNYSFYSPSLSSITIEALDSLENDLTASLENIASCEIEVVNQRSAIRSTFDGQGGLKDRAQRAKMHVKRQYGAVSAEYKSLTKKRY